MVKDGKFMYDMVAKFKAKMALKNAMDTSYKEADKIMERMRKQAKNRFKVN